jgi:hypothetical protein
VSAAVLDMHKSTCSSTTKTMSEVEENQWIDSSVKHRAQLALIYSSLNDFVSSQKTAYMYENVNQEEIDSRAEES